MFGGLRLLLATAVVVMHLTDLTRTSGYQAVFGFYVLSGYLITRVINERYGWSLAGRMRFALNRALRIYPPYWACAALSLVIVGAVPVLAESMNIGLSWPDTAREWLLNAIIIGHTPPGETARLIPPVWSLHVELVFYGAMCLGLSRAPRLSLAWLLASVLLTLALVCRVYLGGDSFTHTLYFSTAAGSLPFAAGACTYWLSQRWRPAVRPHRVFGAVCAFMLACSVAHMVMPGRLALLVSIWSVIPVACFATICLAQHRAGRIDRIAGDLSYPVYLLHWPHSPRPWFVRQAYIGPSKLRSSDYETGCVLQPESGSRNWLECAGKGCQRLSGEGSAQEDHRFVGAAPATADPIPPVGAFQAPSVFWWSPQPAARPPQLRRRSSEPERRRRRSNRGWRRNPIPPAPRLRLMPPGWSASAHAVGSTGSGQHSRLRGSGHSLVLAQTP